MSSLPKGHSARSLVAAVRKLEESLSSAGLPRWVARLPVCWLSWHYCRVLDTKIARSLFAQLGYQSAGLKRRQTAFLEILQTSCASASGMQQALTAHDDAVLAYLRAEQLRERAAAQESAQESAEESAQGLARAARVVQA